jgi:hypothetical protein
VALHLVTVSAAAQLATLARPGILFRQVLHPEDAAWPLSIRQTTQPINEGDERAWAHILDKAHR